MAEMLSYAASLTNSAGKVLEPETITTSDNKKAGQKAQDAEKENRPKSFKAQGGKGSSNRKNAAKNEMLESIESRKAAKEEDIMDKTLKAWDNKRQSLDSDKLPRSRYLKAKTHLNSLDESKQRYVKAEVYLYMIYALLEVYANPISEGQTQKSAAGDDSSAIAATVFDSIRELASAHGLTKAIVDQAQEIVAAMGLPSIEFPIPRLARPLSFTPKIRLADVAKIPLAYKSNFYNAGPTWIEISTQRKIRVSLSSLTDVRLKSLMSLTLTKVFSWSRQRVLGKPSYLSMQWSVSFEQMTTVYWSTWRLRKHWSIR